MSAALVVGTAEIQQLFPHERRIATVTEIADAPFRVIAAVQIPDPAPLRESVPSPSAAAAPEATLPVDPDETDDLLPPAEFPEEVPPPGWTQGRVDRAIKRTPPAAQGLLLPLSAQAFDTVHRTLKASGYYEVRQQVSDTYEEVVSPTREPRREATRQATEPLTPATDAVDNARG